MYKPSDRSQSSFLDFNQPMGLHMNPNNRWVKMADSVPWDFFEKKYSRLFKAKTGNVAKPARKMDWKSQNPCIYFTTCRP